MEQFGVYVHFAFCARKCDYCDFNSVVGTETQRREYLEALVSEIRRAPSGEAGTVYFGGGTPTMYSPDELARVLAEVRGRFAPTEEAEVTFEANPGTVSEPGLRRLREAGFNRISLGVQSLRDDELQLLGRIHTAQEARVAVAQAREAGFANVSVDLIRGLPRQRLEDWQETVEGAIALEPDHISAYGLVVEPGTRLMERVEAGELPKPTAPDDPAWVDWTVGRLAQSGYNRYEISNYARPGFECRHNLNYWRNGEYAGIGAGAWSYLDGERRRNVVDPQEYARVALAEEGLVVEAERLSAEEALGETIMLGLRLTEGISRAELAGRFGESALDRHSQTISRMVEAELMVDDGRRLRLTSKGLLVQNAIAEKFLA